MVSQSDPLVEMDTAVEGYYVIRRLGVHPGWNLIGSCDVDVILWNIFWTDPSQKYRSVEPNVNQQY